jgi:hypothetical protein
VTEKRTNAPGDPGIDPLVWFFEKFAMTDIVQHQAKAAFKIQLRNIEIRNIQQPPLPAFKNGSIKKNSNRYYQYMNGCQQMDKRQISLIVDKSQPEFFIPAEITFFGIYRIRNSGQGLHEKK